MNRNKLAKFNKILDFIFDPRVLFFSLAFFLVAGPWLGIYLRHYGWFMPKDAPPQADITSWLQFVGTRPWYAYLINIPCQQPLYFFFYSSFAILFSKEKDRDKVFFLALWFLIVFLILAFKVWGKEDRYMIPAYPAIAILASLVLSKIKIYLNNLKVNLFLGDIIIGSIIIISCAWSLRLSMPLILSRSDLLPFPL